MEEHTDYKEFERPGGKLVRIVFELYRYEILFHYFEFKHDENSEWKSMSKGEDGYFTYTIKDSTGEEKEERILFPTFEEMSAAQDEINKKYNIISI